MPTNLVPVLHQLGGGEYRRHKYKKFYHSVRIPDLAPVDADPEHLKGVLVRLLRNAITFTPEGGRIVLAAKAGPGHSVMFTVSDTGIGMAPDNDRRRNAPLSARPTSACRATMAATGLGSTDFAGRSWNCWVAVLHFAEHAGRGHGCRRSCSPNPARPALRLPALTRWIPFMNFSNG